MTAPQLARLPTRTPQLPLFWTALTGAVTLAPADFAARLIPVPLDVPVGALTALVGAPYLLWLPGRSHR
ncbi:iron chelate uptake ABC transporter family permease subunit [Streptomyces sp. NPDC057681]|uniref:iron chelate uptake ABC transporter family permease subunit n=1 Tax=Streptomyces sp. NPDC057681 TaxID=3346209 RepID=UPI0036B1108A